MAETYFSHIENGVVVNVVVSETALDPNWVPGYFPIGSAYPPVATVQPTAAELLANAQAAAVAQIKMQAQQQISALDWQVTRAQERLSAGWGTQADLDSVLAQRESLRQSSSAAEAAVNALTDLASVQAYVWTPSTTSVAAPARLTREAFMSRFTDAETQAILTATNTNVALREWWEKFQMVDWVFVTDPSTVSGVNALAVAGLIASTRPAQILATP